MRKFGDRIVIFQKRREIACGSRCDGAVYPVLAGAHQAFPSLHDVHIREVKIDQAGTVINRCACTAADIVGDLNESERKRR